MPQLLLGIDRAILGALGHAQRRRRLTMADHRFFQRRRQGQRFDLTRKAGQADQAHAVPEESRCPRLVRADVRRVVRQHRFVWLGQHRKSDGIGRRAGKHEPHLGICIQPLAYLVRRPLSDLIRAVSPGIACIGLAQRLQRRWGHARRVVRAEVVAHGPMVPWDAELSPQSAGYRLRRHRERRPGAGTGFRSPPRPELPCRPA